MVSSVKITGAALVIFAAGVLTGGLAARLSHRSFRPQRLEPAPRAVERVVLAPDVARHSIDFPSAAVEPGPTPPPPFPAERHRGERLEGGEGRGFEAGRRPGNEPGTGAGGGLGRPPTATRLDNLARVVGQLGLSADQERDVNRIIGAGRERLAKDWAPVSIRMREEIRQIRNEVNQVLTPAQQRQLDEALRAKGGNEQRPPRGDRGDRAERLR